eukprot:TRINITY_DN12928_c0_g1_i1.p1 TRINITY_DN12928_c0_g1~~TRINITY_DN12928_c0_g1_i1.p1  ORF type:complete len:282 (+),score=54.63 TRINITY_DN12928_c0_g1_i1:45-848(+)
MYYDAMVSYMDDYIKQVVNLLKGKNMWDKTLIVFFSDNGGPIYQSGGANNYPLRGGKRSNFEGGIRTNAFISGGYVPSAVRGSKLESFISIEDWYTTFCALAGVDPVDHEAGHAGLPPVDGLNMWPVLSGVSKTSPRSSVLVGNQTGTNGAPGDTIVQGIIIPPYKLLIGVVIVNYWQGPYYPNNTIVPDAGMHDCGTKGCLFNIMEDPTEHYDISDDHPFIVEKMLKQIEDAQKGVFQPNRGPPDQTACTTAQNNYKGYLGPWVTL